LDTKGQEDVFDALVLDSTAFYSGLPSAFSAWFYTPPSIVSEIGHRSISKLTLKPLIESGRLKIIEPNAVSRRIVENVSRESGDSFRLSDADVDLLALALDLRVHERVLLISDDYSVQNLASILGIKTSRTASKGITKVVKWLIYCRGCGKTFHRKKLLSCDVCGTRLSWKIRSR